MRMHGLQLLLAQHVTIVNNDGHIALEAAELLDTFTSDSESEIVEDPSFPIPEKMKQQTVSMKGL